LIRNCTTANDAAKTCTTCNPGCYKSTNGKTCTCVPNCLTATDETEKCTTCKPGCYKSTDGSTCTCVENCLTATDETEKCTTCKPGCYSDDYGASCTCIQNCTNANPYDKCKECQSGFYLSSDHESCNQIEHCLNSNVDNKKTCKTCQEGCYPDENGFCFCIPGCKTINNDNECTECNPGCFLSGTSCDCIEGCKANNNGVCTECNEGCFLSGTSCECIRHCTKFDDSNKCIQCEENYAPSVSGDSCDEINILNCVNHEKTKNECKNCKSYYILSEDKRSCVACNDNNDSTKCGVTLPGCKEVLFSLEDNRIECNICNDGLDKTSLKDQCTQGGLYIAQNKKAIAKSSEIANCIKYETETKCSKCLTGYYIINGKCYRCSDPYESGDGKTCFLPHFNCEEYDDKGKCIKCEDGSVFTKNRQYCINEGAKDPTSSNSNSLNLNIIILLIFILL
jgi:proprotein convertase subtilisin/kexin type 5